MKCIMTEKHFSFLTDVFFSTVFLFDEMVELHDSEKRQCVYYWSQGHL